ncbi:hypothetical protein BASA81_009135 [Batrachochytrium salamandrivorans]|nr:hypothetical protein BASA81_009135 [Batrachochytrium salamandrivorans]
MLKFGKRFSSSSARRPPPPLPPSPSPPPKAVEFWDRLAICKTCPKAAEIIKGFPTICTECGCPVQSKAMFPIFHCPLNKW